MNFKVGDKVVVNSEAKDRYSITVPGSKGIIVEIGRGEFVEVEFIFIPEGKNHHLQKYSIRKKHLEFPSKLERILK